MLKTNNNNNNNNNNNSEVNVDRSRILFTDMSTLNESKIVTCTYKFSKQH